MTTFLLPLPPCGRGTSDIEAMDSYLRRLAIMHGVSTLALLRVLSNWWDKTKNPDEPSMGKYLCYAQTSGFGRDINCLIEVLERSTGFTGLASMTLRAFSLVSGRHVGEVLRDAHHWCPACMLEWEQQGLPPYEKLLWRFKPVSRCPIHKLYLQSKCPGCGQAQVRGADQSWFRCSSCGMRLTSNPRAWIYAPRAPHGERDLVDILRFCSIFSSHVFFADAPATFFKAMKDARGRGRFADAVGDYFHTRENRNKILITSLLRVAQRFQTPLRDILVDPNFASKIRPLPQVDPAKLEDCYTRRAIPRNIHIMLHREIQIALLQGLEGKSLTRICGELGFHPCIARYWFPKLCAALISHQKNLHKLNRDSQTNRLKSLTNDALRRPEITSLGWHKAAELIAERHGVSVYAARKRIDALRQLVDRQ